MQKQSYKIANKTDSRKIAEFLSKDGQLLLPSSRPPVRRAAGAVMKATSYLPAERWQSKNLGFVPKMAAGKSL